MKDVVFNQRHANDANSHGYDASMRTTFSSFPLHHKSAIMSLQKKIPFFNLFNISTASLRQNGAFEFILKKIATEIKKGKTKSLPYFTATSYNYVLYL